MSAMSLSKKLQNVQEDCDINKIVKRPRIESIEKFSFNWSFEISSEEFESELFTPLSKIPAKFRIQALRASRIPLVGYAVYPYEFYFLKCSDEILRDLKVQCEVEVRLGSKSFHVEKKICDLHDRTLLFTGYYIPDSPVDYAKFAVGAQEIDLCNNFMDLFFNFEFVSVLLNTFQSNACLADYKSLYDSKELSDVSILVGKDVLKAHKLVLAARSPVFKAMFAHKFVEELTNCVEIEENFDSCSVDCFLRYVYYGDMGNNIDFDTISQIFCLANKYQVADLEKHCSNTMAVELSLDNALKIVVLADKYCDAWLKEKAVALIFQHLQEMIQHKNWKDFSENHPNLFKEILRLD